MRKVNFLFVGLLFVFITSCKKNDNYRIVNILDGKIKTVSGIGYTEFYYYNQDGIIDKTGHNTDSSYFYYYKKDDTIFLTSDTINYVRNPLLIYDNKKYILENGLAIVKTGSEEIYYYQYFFAIHFLQILKMLQIITGKIVLVFMSLRIYCKLLTPHFIIYYHLMLFQLTV